MRSGILGKMYRDGEIIYRQGEMGDSMYVVESGQVELLQRKDDKEYCLAMLGPGEFFGLSALFAQDVRSATVRAVGEDTCVLRLQRKAFMKRAHEDASFMVNMVEKLIQRIRELEASLVRVGEQPYALDLQATADKDHTRT
ncbi:MAG TPA: cyclic nucleotide-binding domain-containing protein [Terriglobales bacterium]|nr:cyclic nucleotide-binding domain-containing protein [Terriglobales bacterium]